MTLQRLILSFEPEEIVIHALYKSKDGPSPNTKGRTREVTELTRDGLKQALEDLQDGKGVEMVGTSGFTQRQDVLSLQRGTG